MRLLLDTNVLLRLTEDSPEIGPSLKSRVEDGLSGGLVAVSVATFAEAARLHHQGHLDLGSHPAVWRRERLRSGLREIPVDGNIAVESVLLMETGFHRDPVDQMVVATAMLADMDLATTDRQIIEWAQRVRLVRLADPTL